jgi:hypothetical protein
MARLVTPLHKARRMRRTKFFGIAETAAIAVLLFFDNALFTLPDGGKLSSWA